MKLAYTYILVIVFGALNLVKAQVGIGTSSPNSSSMLDVYSTSKGVSFPSYSLASLTDATNPINNPADGLLIYNTGGTYSKGLYYWYVDSWNKLFLNSDISHSMVLSTTANTTYDATYGTVGGSPFIYDTSPAGNKFSTFGLVGNTITGGSFNQTNSTITLPQGKYKIEFSVDLAKVSWGTGVTPLNSTAQQIYYASFNTFLRDTSGNQLANRSLDNEIITGTFATFYTCFYIDLSATTTFSLYLDFANDGQKGTFRPRAGAELQIYELKD